VRFLEEIAGRVTGGIVGVFRVPLIIAFQTKTSEINSGKAENQNARRWCYSPSRTHFDLSTPPESIAAVCSQNELLEVPFSKSRVLSVAYFYVRVFDAPFQGLLVGVRRMCREGFP